MTRDINYAGLQIIKECEGCKLEAYPDPGTGGEPWTIGYGHTGPEVKPGLIWTQEQADSALQIDLYSRCTAVGNFTRGVSLNDSQFSALVSFAYNVGIWRTSTLFKLVNEGRLEEAAEQFILWVHSGGRVLSGLVNRRQRERELFETPD